MPTKTDPTADGLLGLTRRTGGHRLKVDALFGDRPELLEAIRTARRDNGVAAEHIAEFLTAREGVHISGAAVAKWLTAQGIR